MTAFQDWQISVEFKAPKGDVDGVWTEAVLEAGLKVAPECVAGMVAGADTKKGRVTLTFSALDTSQEFANSILEEMRERVPRAIVAGGEGSVVSACD